MNKKKLQAAIAPFPIKQSDKERFVNTIAEMSSSGGGGVEYEYYKVSDRLSSQNNNHMLIIMIMAVNGGEILLPISIENGGTTFINSIPIGHVAISSIGLGTLLGKSISNNIKLLNSKEYKIYSINNDYTLFYGTEPLILKGDSLKEAMIDFINKNKDTQDEILQNFILICKDVINILTPITKETYESLIGQEVPA